MNSTRVETDNFNKIGRYLPSGDIIFFIFLLGPKLKHVSEINMARLSMTTSQHFINADLFYFMQVGDRGDTYLDPDIASPMESPVYHEFLGFLIRAD